MIPLDRAYDRYGPGSTEALAAVGKTKRKEHKAIQYHAHTLCDLCDSFLCVLCVKAFFKRREREGYAKTAKRFSMHYTSLR